MQQKLSRSDRYQGFIEYFSKEMPNAETELEYNNEFELLIAVILSAQCTDKRVNLVTRELFARFPNPVDLANSNFDELFPYIKSISYPNNKTKHLLGASKLLIDEFEGEVPESMEDLQKLPGVGRKTANVISSVIYNKPAMAVDTHVYRVSKRIGLVPEGASTPLAVEKHLIKNISEEHIPKAHHWLILHGRYVCLARKPKCDQCKITHFCKYFEKQNK